MNIAIPILIFMFWPFHSIAVGSSWVSTARKQTRERLYAATAANGTYENYGSGKIFLLVLECKCKELFGICFRMTFLLVKGMIQSNYKFLINIKQNLINIKKKSGSLATEWLKRLGFKRGQNISDEFKFTIKSIRSIRCFCD